MTVATGCKWTVVRRPWLQDQRSTVAKVCSIMSDHLEPNQYMSTNENNILIKTKQKKLIAYN